ncbi:hypothetical protein BT96DRAFT_919389, partial [Gymnopus androsaceus JB14]
MSNTDVQRLVKSISSLLNELLLEIWDLVCAKEAKIAFFKRKESRIRRLFTVQVRASSSRIRVGIHVLARYYSFLS